MRHPVKMGKRPARVNATILKLADYWDHTAVTDYVPAEFGAENLDVPWPMQGNDLYSCAVWAGAAHETRLWGREAGQQIAITTENTLSDYATADEFRADDPATDRGSDLQAAASYRRRIGILDANGNRHTIGAYVALTPGDPDQLAAAVFAFAAIGVGLRMPDYAVDEFGDGQPWKLRHGNTKIVGGQYVPVVGRGADGDFCAIAWGRVQPMNAGFYRRFCDEALCYFSPEFLNSLESPPGFDRIRLLADLEAFTRR